ncbi:MAG TPA: hypothetical protein VH309_00095, partial [Elusimicrobiota bacterium]|nr:hypothetical protein [Elusimicrobiota bacterium]
GAGFEFIRERSLSLSLPIAAPGPWGVEHGALLGFRSDPAGQAAAAERSINRLLGRGEEGPRLSDAPRGEILFNATLARKWKLSPPRDDPRWKALR